MKKIIFSIAILLMCGVFSDALAQENPAAKPLTTDDLLALPPEAPQPEAPAEPAAVPAAEVAPTAPEAVPAVADTAKPEDAEKPAEEPVSALQKSMETNAKKAENIWPHGSIMFSESTMKDLHAAIRSHAEGVPLEILLPNLFAVERAPEPETPKQAAPTPSIEPTPQAQEAPKKEEKTDAVGGAMDKYYLKSIMYFAPDNWTLWLNKQKISVDDPAPPGISFVKVTSGSVAVLWKSANPDALYQGWKDKFIALGDDLWASTDGNIVIRDVVGDISFLIRPNQTFMPNIMQIIEGSGVEATAASTDTNSESKAISANGEANPAAATKAVDISLPAEVDKDINSPHMKRYLGQINMLKSVLAPSAPAENATPPAN